MTDDIAALVIELRAGPALTMDSPKDQRRVDRLHSIADIKNEEVIMSPSKFDVYRRSLVLLNEPE